MAAYPRLQLKLRESCGLGEGREARDFLWRTFPVSCPVRAGSETHRTGEVSPFACNRRMPPVSFLQSEPASERIPSPYGIHRKTAAFSIGHIDTNRQCLAPLRQCMAFVSQSPVYLAWDSFFVHVLGARGDGFLNIFEAAPLR